MVWRTLNLKSSQSLQPYLWHCRLYGVGCCYPINKMMRTGQYQVHKLLSMFSQSPPIDSLSLSLFTHIATILSNNKMGTGAIPSPQVVNVLRLFTHTLLQFVGFLSWARFWVRIIPRLPFFYFLFFIFNLFIVLLITSTLGFPLYLTFSQLVVWLFWAGSLRLPKTCLGLAHPPPPPQLSQSTFIVFSSFSTQAFCDTQLPTLR